MIGRKEVFGVLALMMVMATLNVTVKDSTGTGDGMLDSLRKSSKWMMTMDLRSHGMHPTLPPSRRIGNAQEEGSAEGGAGAGAEAAGRAAGADKSGADAGAAPVLGGDSAAGAAGAAGAAAAPGGNVATAAAGASGAAPPPGEAAAVGTAGAAPAVGVAAAEGTFKIVPATRVGGGLEGFTAWGSGGQSEEERKWNWKAGIRPQESVGGIPLDRNNCSLGGPYCPGGELDDERGKDMKEQPFPPDADIRRGNAEDQLKFKDAGVGMLHVPLSPGFWNQSGHSTPRVIHTVWTSKNLSGNNIVPDYVKNNLRRWRAVEPNYRTIIWMNEDVEYHFPEIVPLLKQIPMPAWIADIVRYGIIYRFGGVFLDSDTQPVRPFDKFIQAVSPFTVCTGGTGYSETQIIYKLTAAESLTCRRYANGIFGAPPWSIHMGTVFNEAVWRSIHMGRNGTKKFDFGFTGPFLWTTYLRAKPLTFLPMHTFMPCTWRNIQDCIVEKYLHMPQVFGMHMWESSWTLVKGPRWKARAEDMRQKATALAEANKTGSIPAIPG